MIGTLTIIWVILVRDEDPDYTGSRHSYNKRIATKCRICGQQMTHPKDCVDEVHLRCLQTYKKKTYGVN